LRSMESPSRRPSQSSQQQRRRPLRRQRKAHLVLAVAVTVRLQTTGKTTTWLWTPSSWRPFRQTSRRRSWRINGLSGGGARQPGAGRQRRERGLRRSPAERLLVRLQVSEVMTWTWQPSLPRSLLTFARRSSSRATRACSRLCPPICWPRPRASGAAPCVASRGGASSQH